MPGVTSTIPVETVTSISPRPGARQGQRGRMPQQVFPFQPQSFHMSHHHHHNHDHSLLHALYDNNRTFLESTSASSHMFHPPIQHVPIWHHQAQRVSFSVPPPPQIAHKVWILDCKSCGTFLTNRGMKAVLLLRPNVSLFSTDALPVNCSANTEALRDPVCHSRPPPRTCECLTQTISCHGCGNNVGYMIVTPCTRCTSSITAAHRTTNGHRFVFHSNEITSTERHYIPNEPGVIPCEPPISPTQPPPLFNPHSPVPSPPYHDYLPTHLEQFDPMHNPPHVLDDHIFPYTRVSSPLHQRPVFPAYSHPFFQGPPADQKDTVPTRTLVDGEVLYWHHLVRNGEIPGVEDDPRARSVPTHQTNKANSFAFDR